jgi:transcriptional regulator with XRE-family HTH domain
MYTRSERFSQAKSLTGLSDSEFAAKLKIKGITLRRLEEGKEIIQKRVLKCMLTEFNVSPNWILTGLGSILAQPEEKELYNKKEQQKYTHAELLEKAQQAKKLYLEQRLTQKEIAAILDVSEKTMSEWKKKYKWDFAAKKTLVMDNGNLELRFITGFVEIKGFAEYLRERDPECFEKAVQHLSMYLFEISL